MAEKVIKCKNCLYFTKPKEYDFEVEEGLCSLLSFSGTLNDVVEALPIVPDNPNVKAVLIVSETFNCKHYERSSD